LGGGDSVGAGQVEQLAALYHNEAERRDQQAADDSLKSGVAAIDVEP
jgi:hypothetical protein